MVIILSMLIFCTSIIYGKDVLVNGKQDTLIEQIIKTHTNSSDAIRELLAHNNDIKDITIKETDKIIYVNIKYYPLISKIEIDDSLGQGIISMIRKVLKNNHIHPRSACNDIKIREAICEITKGLHTHGYFGLYIHPYIIQDNDNHVVLGFKFDKLTQFAISHVYIKGNHAFSTNKLLRYTVTSKKPFYMYIPFMKYFMQSDNGQYKAHNIETDVKRLKNFYFKHGYVNAKVESYSEVIDNKLTVTFEIHEGKKYKFGHSFNNPSCAPNITCFGHVLSACEKAKYTLQQDVTYACQIHGDIADVFFHYKLYDQVYISKIEIYGNRRLSSELIRRVININEGDLIHEKSVKDIHTRLSSIGGISDSEIYVNQYNGQNTLIVKIDEDTESLRPEFRFELSTNLHDTGGLKQTSLVNSFLSRNSLFNNPGLAIYYINNEVYGKKIRVLVKATKSLHSHGINLNIINPNITNTSSLGFKTSLLSQHTTLPIHTEKIYAKTYYGDLAILHTKLLSNIASFTYGPKFTYNKFVRYQKDGHHSVSESEVKALLNKNILSKFYGQNTLENDSIVSLILSPVLRFHDINGNYIKFSSNLEVPLYSTSNYYTHSIDKITAQYTLNDTLMLRSKFSVSTLFIHKGHVSELHKLSYMPNVFGFDEISGYGPRDVQTESVLGSNQYIHLKNSVILPVQGFSNAFSIGCALFASTDLLWYKVPNDEPYYESPDKKINHTLSKPIASISAGLHFSEVPFLRYVNVGFAHPIKAHKEINQTHNPYKHVTPYGHLTTNLVLTVGKKHL